MLYPTAAELFESTDSPAVLSDPANEDWLAVVKAIEGTRYEVLERRYYVALYHFRRQPRRPGLTGRTEISAPNKAQALQEMLLVLTERRTSNQDKGASPRSDTFVDVRPDREDSSLPESLRDWSTPPPSIGALLDGPGRPPCDALCLMRAFLAAPLLGVGDSPSSVFNLLRSNPTFARACGFLGRETLKQLGELTSRRLPSLSVCEEFSEVMARYGIWQCGRIEQVRDNLQEGVVEIEDTVSFDTTHVEANSHCANVVPEDAKVQEGKMPKHRKVARIRKSCSCGKQQWESCEHAWTSTDQGAAVVVKGPTRIFWAHKASVVAFGDSEIPFDVRALNYAAEHDGNTLLPHLELLNRDFPEVTEALRHVLADDAYQGKHEAVARFGQHALLTVPVHPSGKSKTQLATSFAGINRFTPIGVPVCEAGHRFEMRGRDLASERYIWAAPDNEYAKSVCIGCPLADACLKKGTRRNIRVERDDFPQINWDHPQHFARNNARYQKRTGVERAIKRIKVDLDGEYLTHRGVLRVQAHLDRKLLTLHLLLRAAKTSG